MRQVSDPIPPARSLNREIDQATSDWIERMLVKEPADRVRSAAEAWDQLEEIVPRWRWPRWRRSARLPAPRRARGHVRARSARATRPPPAKPRRRDTRGPPGASPCPRPPRIGGRTEAARARRAAVMPRRASQPVDDGRRHRQRGSAAALKTALAASPRRSSRWRPPSGGGHGVVAARLVPVVRSGAAGRAGSRPSGRRHPPSTLTGSQVLPRAQVPRGLVRARRKALTTSPRRSRRLPSRPRNRPDRSRPGVMRRRAATTTLLPARFLELHRPAGRHGPQRRGGWRRSNRRRLALSHQSRRTDRADVTRCRRHARRDSGLRHGPRPVRVGSPPTQRRRRR
jgi:hypothetical protein